ncbi:MULTISPECIES: hypothetical protein [unclassified Kitasatospora]|uniref:hypothetical protein n=1 Tax=unclassified Kitasatospora TaxID=2633591 RepID=UPI002475E96D|nr:hypothetical protein [Kitasatospora sp. MAP12-44]
MSIPSVAWTFQVYAPSASAVEGVQLAGVPELTDAEVPDATTVEPLSTWKFSWTGSPSGSVALAEKVGRLLVTYVVS